MTPEQFCYWLQGYCEMDGMAPSTEQWAQIVEHLQLVFDKQTPEHPTLPEPPNWPPLREWRANKVIC